MPKPGGTVAQGYGARHRRIRAAYDVRVQAGQAECWRCGVRLVPGQPWHLGHDDEDRTRYRGPECVPCNTSTAAVRGNRARAAPTPPFVGRDWRGRS